MHTHLRLVEESSTDRIARLNAQADAILADAMRLRAQLRNGSSNLPLAGAEADALIAAIGAFVRASAR